MATRLYVLRLLGADDRSSQRYTGVGAGWEQLPFPTHDIPGDTVQNGIGHVDRAIAEIADVVVAVRRNGTRDLNDTSTAIRKVERHQPARWKDVAMTPSMNVASSLGTPGVYITEIDAFGSSIVGVDTAVPVFVGYTRFAGDPVSGAPLYHVPVAITSLAEFVQWFGGAAPPRYRIVPADRATGPVLSRFTADVPIDSTNGATASTRFAVQTMGGPANPDRFDLYRQMQLFFANGGGACHVVSVGSYWVERYPVAAIDPVPADWVPGSITAGDPDGPGAAGLLRGLAVAGMVQDATMIVIPEACQLGLPDYARVACAMIEQAGTLQDRIAVLDLPGCLTADTLDALRTCQADLWSAIAPQAGRFGYAAAYGPALRTVLATAADGPFTTGIACGGDATTLLNTLLTADALQRLEGAHLRTIRAAIATAYPPGAAVGGQDTAWLSVDRTSWPQPLHNGAQALPQGRRQIADLLRDTLPVYARIEAALLDAANLASPSGTLAGCWARSDQMNGVWNAPANLAIAGVSAPLCNMNDSEQSGFNQPVNGQAINILRAQPGRGTVVWGARTLDANSLAYRYIQVRRTLIYIEQSIRLALQPYVFASNDALIWSQITAALSSFLTGVWQQGGLMGAKPADAFQVACGLGTTMTAADITNGQMIVRIHLAVLHPGEFVECTFVQTMAE